MKYFIIGIYFLSTLCFAEEKIFNLSRGVLDIKNSSGGINITGVEGEAIKVSYTKAKWEKGCSLVLKKKGDKVVIKVEKKSGAFSSSPECDVNFKVSMPKKVELIVKLGSGDISIEGIESRCEFKVGSGDIAITKSIINSLSSKLGSGDISAKGQFGKMNFKTGSGKISVVINKVIGKTILNVKSGSGDVSVMVPKSIKVNASFKSGSGEFKNKVAHNVDGSVIINAKTGSGDLTIENI